MSVGGILISGKAGLLWWHLSLGRESRIVKVENQREQDHVHTHSLLPAPDGECVVTSCFNFLPPRFSSVTECDLKMLVK